MSSSSGSNSLASILKASRADGAGLDAPKLKAKFDNERLTFAFSCVRLWLGDDELIPLVAPDKEADLFQALEVASMKTPPL